MAGPVNRRLDTMHLNSQNNSSFSDCLASYSRCFTVAGSDSINHIIAIVNMPEKEIRLAQSRIH